MERKHSYLVVTAAAIFLVTAAAMPARVSQIGTFHAGA